MPESLVENRVHSRRASGTAGASAGYDPGKLAREMQRLKSQASPMNDSLHAYNTPKTAWAALKHGKVKAEQAVELAYNLGLIRDQLSTTANQAKDLIKQAATGDFGSFDVDVSKPTPVAQPQKVVAADANGMRPLTRDERKHAKSLDMKAAEYLQYINANPGVVAPPAAAPRPKIKMIPLKEGQGNDAFTGNGLQQPNQVGRDEDQQEEMRSLPRQEKHEHQNRASDHVQTESDNDPVIDGHGAPTRHASENPSEKVARLQRELEEALRQERQTSYLAKIQKKLASLDEGQLAEVEAVVDDFLYIEASSDNVKISDSVDRVVQGEVVSKEEIDAILENYGHADPQDT